MGFCRRRKEIEPTHIIDWSNCHQIHTELEEKDDWQPAWGLDLLRPVQENRSKKHRCGAGEMAQLVKLHPKHPRTKPGTVVHAYTPRAREAEIGESLGHTGQPA